MKERVLLAAARTEWSANMQMRKCMLTHYEGCLAANYSRSAEDADYYLSCASDCLVEAHKAAEPFGDAAKKEPNLLDKVFLFIFGRFYL